MTRPGAATRGRDAAAHGSALIAVGVGTLLAGCWEVTRPSLPPEVDEVVVTLPPRPTAVEVALREDVEDPVAEEELPRLPTGPGLDVGEVQGATPAALGAMLAPVLSELERCQTSSTGKLVVRLVAEPGSTHLRLVDDGLDPATTRCAMSALGTIELEEAFQPSRSQSDAARRVETQLVLTW